LDRRAAYEMRRVALQRLAKSCLRRDRTHPGRHDVAQSQHGLLQEHEAKERGPSLYWPHRTCIAAGRVPVSGEGFPYRPVTTHAAAASHPVQAGKRASRRTAHHLTLYGRAWRRAYCITLTVYVPCGAARQRVHSPASAWRGDPDARGLPRQQPSEHDETHSADTQKEPVVQRYVRWHVAYVVNLQKMVIDYSLHEVEDAPAED